MSFSSISCARRSSSPVINLRRAELSFKLNRTHSGSSNASSSIEAALSTFLIHSMASVPRPLAAAMYLKRFITQYLKYLTSGKGSITLDGGKHVRQVLKSLERIQRPNGQQAYWIKLWQWISNQNRRISVNELLRLQGTNPFFFVQILFSIFQLVGVLFPTAKARWKTYNTRKLLWGSRLSSRSSASAGASDKSLPPGIASSQRPRVQRATTHCKMHS